MDAINCKLESNFCRRNSTLLFKQLDQTYKTRTKDGLLWSLKFDEGHRQGNFCSIKYYVIICLYVQNTIELVTMLLNFGQKARSQMAAEVFCEYLSDKNLNGLTTSKDFIEVTKK